MNVSQFNAAELLQQLGLIKEKSMEDVVATALDAVLSSYSHSDQALRGVVGAGYKVDEMAILIPGEHAFMEFACKAAGLEGYELFNSASDHVYTGPILAEYHVDYLFLRTPHEYRVEVMRLTNGYSPLHSGMALKAQAQNDALAVFGVHASFKCQTEQAYATSQAALMREGWQLAQQCNSTYGKFSYYSHPDHLWYMKPRMNLRDAETGDE